MTLTLAELAAIEARAKVYKGYPMDVPDLVAECRRLRVLLAVTTGEAGSLTPREILAYFVGADDAARNGDLLWDFINEAAREGREIVEASRA